MASNSFSIYKGELRTQRNLQRAGAGYILTAQELYCIFFL
jgi:hypothetical protein